MDSENSAKSSKPVTPIKNQFSKASENSNPNVSLSTTADLKKPTNNSSSPVPKSATKGQKSASKNAVLNQNVVALYSPRNKIRERKFVVAKKNKKNSKNEMGNGSISSNSTVDCKCKARFGGNVNKCSCMAYETLRASQEEFFKNQDDGVIEEKEDEILENEKGTSDDDHDRAERDFEQEQDEEKEIEKGSGGQLGVSTIKRRRERLLEAARNSIPESGTGAVMHLIKAFERLKTIPDPRESEKIEDEGIKESKNKVMQWALPGLQHPNVPEFHPTTKVLERQNSPSSLCPSDLFLNSENLGLDPKLSVSSSWDSSQGSISSRTSNGGRRSRRNSSESCGTMRGRRWKKNKMKITCQKPFKLMTEERGRLKEEEFMKKLQEMMIEEEKQRIPIAQGLPWTTDEPENLIKPPVKGSTRILDLKLRSDIRAEERAEFDHQVAEKLSFIEHYKMERERLQKLAEEEEIRRLRKELVPKAQPMPYFDRPFIPRRSTKHPTIPKEPNFHIPQHKKIKSCLSWNDLSTFTYQE